MYRGRWARNGPFSFCFLLCIFCVEKRWYFARKSFEKRAGERERDSTARATRPSISQCFTFLFYILHSPSYTLHFQYLVLYFQYFNIFSLCPLWYFSLYCVYFPSILQSFFPFFRSPRYRIQS